MKEPNNEQMRRLWLERQLQAIPAGKTLLDVGAGECQYKPSCSHLDYTAQDVGEYDGGGNERGLQTGSWDFSKIDIICDILEIPEDRKYDAVLCTEVLEHVPDPAASLRKLTRLVADNGILIVTAPFASLTHFAPYHFGSGFSEYFYRHHLEAAGFTIETMEPNGGYFDYIAQELGRAKSVSSEYLGRDLGLFPKLSFKLARYLMKGLARADGARNQRKSGELLTFGWHVRARRKTS